MDYDMSDEKKMESGGEAPQNPWESADFQRFLKYREEKAADLRILEAWRREKKSRSRILLPTKGKRIVKAAVVVALFGAVSIGVGKSMADAGEDSKPIRWLVRELTYERAVLEPTAEDRLLAMEPLGKDEAAVYTCGRPEELPGAYRDCLVDLEGLPGLEGYEQGEITLATDAQTWKIDSRWQSGQSQYVIFAAQGIKDKVALFDWRYGQGEGTEVCFREIGSLKGRVERQPAQDGKERVMASFTLGNRWYSVRGMLSVEEIGRIAAGYAERLLEN